MSVVVAAARELLGEASGDERELLREELLSAEADLGALEAELKVLLLPRDPNDGKNVIVEIRGAEASEVFDRISGKLAGRKNGGA